MGIATATVASLLTAAASSASGGERGMRVAEQEGARVSIAAIIHAVPASETSLPIEITHTAAVPKNSFLRIRGLPPYVALSEGHSISPGAWAIPLFAVSSLKVTIPTGSTGRYEVVVTLLRVDGTQLAEARSALIIEDVAIFRSQPGIGEPERAITAPLPLPANRPGRVGTLQPPDAVSDEERSRRARLAAQGARYVAQGEQFLAEGNMAAARQFFQRAADGEYAPGAMRLAETYDPAELARLQAQGIAGDKVEARKWYERARQLGAAGADARLARLDQN